MNQEEKNQVILKELSELIPNNLSSEEKSIWRMCFNALRLADFATANPSDGKIIAMFATIQTIFAGHCASMSGPVLNAQKNIIVFTCASPNSNTTALLKAKESLFPDWSFVVESHPAPPEAYDKIEFTERHSPEKLS